MMIGNRANSWRSRIGVLLELSKSKIIDLWLGAFVALSLIPAASWQGLTGVVTFVLLLLSWVLVAALTCTLDDIVGMRDGVDELNHAGTSRFGVSKPLLDGRLTERQAIVYAVFLAVGAGLATALAFAIAPSGAGWLFVAHVVICTTAINYSWGLKLSYRGAGEAVVFLAAAGTVVVQFGVVVGDITPQAWCNGLLVGLWLAQVVLFSNTKDAAGDRAAGRMTIAARTSPLGNRVFIASSFLAGWIMCATLLAGGWLPVWYALALAPVCLVQLYQLRAGIIRQEWLKARFLGFWNFRLGVALLIVCNIVSR